MAFISKHDTTATGRSLNFRAACHLPELHPPQDLEEHASINFTCCRRRAKLDVVSVEPILSGHRQFHVRAGAPAEPRVQRSLGRDRRVW